ncbi:MAG: adenylyltransferase/cytidyltransferase family protein [Acidimicrobiales bacterium]
MSTSGTGVALGSFDAFHIGHQTALRAAVNRAAASGVRLVIAIADDALVAARCGRAPMVPHDERLEVVAAFFPEQAVEIVTTDVAASLVERFNADRFYVGGPESAGDTGPPQLIVVPFEMTSSPALLRTVEPDVLWTPA